MSHLVTSIHDNLINISALSQNYKKRLLAKSVCPSFLLTARKISASTGRIFTKFESRVFSEKYVEKIQVSLKSDKNNGHFT
jgi:hypothetical protein